MSINPQSLYDTFTYNRLLQPIWSINGPFSGDFVAGLFVGLSVIIDDMIANYGYMLVNDNIQITGRNEIIQIFFNDSLSVTQTLTNYIIVTGTPRERFTQYHHILTNYGWWIIQPLQSNKYVLYSFASPDFIQGFVSICNAFNVDFRDYIVGTPFRYDPKTRTIINFEIEGYDVEYFTTESKRPAPTGPYYTGTYEGDANAVDFN